MMRVTGARQSAIRPKLPNRMFVKTLCSRSLRSPASCSFHSRNIVGSYGIGRGTAMKTALVALALLAASLVLMPPAASGATSASSLTGVWQLVSLTAYTGTYTVEGDEWTTHVDAAKNPDWDGGDQVRRFSIDRDRLIVTTPWQRSTHIAGSPVVRARLIFRRIETLRSLPR